MYEMIIFIRLNSDDLFEVAAVISNYSLQTAPEVVAGLFTSAESNSWYCSILVLRLVIKFEIHFDPL